MIIVNALGGLDNPNAAVPDASGPIEGAADMVVDDRAIADARASGVTAVNITLGYVAGDVDPLQHTVDELDVWDAHLARRPADLALIRTATDIQRAHDDDRIGVIYGFQNAAMMGDDAGRVDYFADRGVRVIQLSYNPANQLGDGAMAPANRGLTEFGREVVARLNDRRIMVDLSHSGETTCLDAIRASAQPVSINHTGCRALTDLPRNKTDEELRLVAEGGGFVGIYFMPFLAADGQARAEDVVAHIRHAVDVCGEDHVGIGTDGSITSYDDLDAYRRRLVEEHARRSEAGIAATGEGADTLPFVVDLRGVDQFHRLVALLADAGFSRTRIEKILGTNFVDFAREVWND
jgi:membrane dipeptidase